MNMVELIAKKRDGEHHTLEEIAYIVRGLSSIPDYQISAWLMAVCFQGMDAGETTALTLEMARSGDRLDLSRIRGFPVDKHSTGGVGDTTTLISVPLAAACGAPVVKMSGRSLSHTGGTLDKLWAIPGMRTELAHEALLAQVRRIGCALVGQSGDLCPADKRLYALRDVTATVGSLPLIAASIMSKKIAAGCKALVLDVKCGNGALLTNAEDTMSLARRMVDIGTLAGMRTVALVTDMSQPLGTHIGNALEVKEAIDTLSGRLRGPLADISLTLAAHMVSLSLGIGLTEAASRVERALSSGDGLVKLTELISAQGGDARVCGNTGLLPTCARIQTLVAQRSGFIISYDTPAIGRAAQALGAGRERVEDIIDSSVGLILHKRVGDRVTKGDPLFDAHIGLRGSVDSALALLSQSVVIGDTPPTTPPLILSVVS